MKITRIELDPEGNQVSKQTYNFNGTWFHDEMLLHHEKGAKIHYNTETGEQFPPEIEILLEARFQKQCEI